MEIETLTFDNIKRTLTEFLENDGPSGNYIDRIKQTVHDGKFRLIVDINQLRNFNRPLTDRLMRRPREIILALQDAAVETIQNNDPTISKYLKQKDIQVGFEGSFGRHTVSPRGLSSHLLNHLIQLEGIVTKCSTIRPKLMKSVHYCEKTNSYLTREYRDNTSLDIGIEYQGRERLPTGSSIPIKDAEGNSLDFEYGLSYFKDYQTVTIQEMPERAKVGQLPRSVDIILEHDLSDRVKPGDRIQVVGVYRPLPSIQNGQNSTTSGVFKSVVLSNNVSILGKEVGMVNLTGHDVKNIREIAQIPNILDILSQSLCPSIFGHEYIKKALILQLLSGCEKNLNNGTHLRGDINILMVGDPSTAKSQLLRSIMEVAPLAISTTGRGSSGVGLTAAVTLDSDTKEKRLEAGAMVLADRGIVCIDEFDKMSENDRVAIHEVMEQQTVTIAKAGIHASLNARCSVLAAANPVYGQYDKTRRPQENIGLPDSLLSRFDLLFIVLDEFDTNLDKILSTHIVKSHQYRKAGVIMEPEPLNQYSKIILDSFEQDEETRIWLKSSSSTTGRSLDSGGSTEHGEHHHGDILTSDFLKKYIYYAKNRIQPILSDDAMELITESYSAMRNKQTQRTLPVTARSLETIIRLSSACAKARLSGSVDIIDVNTALELMNFVYYHEMKNPTVTSDNINSTDTMEDDEDGNGESTTKNTEKKRKSSDINPDNSMTNNDNINSNSSNNNQDTSTDSQRRRYNDDSSSITTSSNSNNNLNNNNLTPLSNRNRINTTGITHYNNYGGDGDDDENTTTNANVNKSGTTNTMSDDNESIKPMIKINKNSLRYLYVIKVIHEYAVKTQQDVFYLSDILDTLNKQTYKQHILSTDTDFTQNTENYDMNTIENNINTSYQKQEVIAMLQELENENKCRRFQDISNIDAYFY